MTPDLFNPELFLRSGETGKTFGWRNFDSARVIMAHTSKTVTGIELRMLPPLIIENHSTPVWPFPGYSKLYCLTIVVSDVANQLIGGIDIKGFPRIGDHEYLPVNKTVFYWQAKKIGEQPPRQVHVLCSIVKTKQALRDVGRIMAELSVDAEYQAAISTIGKLNKDASKFNIVSSLVMQLGSIAGRYLGKIDDKPISTILNSYTAVNGDFDHPGVKKLVYSTKDVHFNFDLIVRNEKVEKKVHSAMKNWGQLITQNSNAEETVEVNMIRLPV
jgi:hypothetical protein